MRLVTNNDLTYVIQVWSYDQILFAADNTVDRLSLYLSLKDDRHERVEEITEEMMKGLVW